MRQGRLRSAFGLSGSLRRNDVLPHSIEILQQGREPEHLSTIAFRPVLLSGSREQAALKVHKLPFEMQDLAKASPRPNQQPKCGRNVSVDLDAAISGLGACFARGLNSSIS